MTQGPEGYGLETAEVDVVTLYLERIALRQSDLNMAAITQSLEELDELQEEILEELGALCPYTGEEVCLSGMALMPEAIVNDYSGEEDDDSGDSIAVAVLERNAERGTVYGRTNGVLGIYQQVVIRLVQGKYGQEFRIRHAIIVDHEVEIEAEGTLINNRTIVALFEHDSTIQPVDEIEDSLRAQADSGKLPSEEVAKIIDTYSSKVVRLINDAQFRRLPLAQQQLKLQTLIAAAERKSRVQDRYVSIAFHQPASIVSTSPRDRDSIHSTRHVYVPTLVQGEVVMRRRNNVPETLGGMCLGVECLERPALRRQPIKNDSDVLDTKAGLSLLVDPDRESTDALGLDEKTLIYVPVSGQDFDAQFE